MNAAQLYESRKMKSYSDTKFNLRRAQEFARNNSEVVSEFTFIESSKYREESKVTVCYYRNFTFGYCNFDSALPIEICDQQNQMIQKVATYPEAVAYIDSIA